MDDQYLQQFSRHILLDEIGVEGQQGIADGHVAIIGMGGLGCPAAQYLAAAGVGELTLIDHDTVDLTNLQRQVLHTQSRIGLAKVASAYKALATVNPRCNVHARNVRLDDKNGVNLLSSADIILDCSDNFETRHLVNRLAIRLAKPLVSGAAVRFGGQLTTFYPSGPCYECLFPTGEEVEETRCALMGVFSPATGVIGTLQAAEALKLLSNAGQPLVGKLLIYDALAASFRQITYSKDPCCKVCSNT